MEKIYNKLVRDKIPEICIENGEHPFTRTLNNDEYWHYLIEKDKEELEEVRTASSKDDIKMELADKLEIIRAMAIYNGFSLQEIIDIADEKSEKRGGFSKKIFLEKVVKE